MELQELNERLMNNSMNMVYKMEELNEVVHYKTASQLLIMTKNNFNIDDSYFEFDGYGNLKSYSTLDEVLEMYDDVQ